MIMWKDNRIIDIIEDHESIVQALGAISIALRTNKPLPSFIPVLHDALVTDYLSNICEHLNAKKNE